MKTPESIGLAAIVPLETIHTQAADPSPFQTLIEKVQQPSVLALPLLEPTNANPITLSPFFGLENNPFFGGSVRGVTLSMFTYWALVAVDEIQSRFTHQRIPESFKLGATLISNIAAATFTRFNEIGIGRLLEPAPTQLAAAGVIAGIFSYAAVHLVGRPTAERRSITEILSSSNKR